MHVIIWMNFSYLFACGRYLYFKNKNFILQKLGWVELTSCKLHSVKNWRLSWFLLTLFIYEFLWIFMIFTLRVYVPFVCKWKLRRFLFFWMKMWNMILLRCITKLKIRGHVNILNQLHGKYRTQIFEFIWKWSLMKFKI